MNFTPEIANNHLPLLPPKKFVENAVILKQLIKTHRVLAELKGYSEMLPNKHIVLNAIILQEAKDSSAIENIITTHDELYKAIALQRKDTKTEVKEVLNYRTALYKGLADIKNKGFLSTNMIISIQNEIEDNNAGLRKLPGTKLMNDRTGEIMYTPPDNENSILNLMKNIEEFINYDDDELDPLIKMAMLHYQFEAIHPFYDGNGRTGRIINVLYLVLKNLLQEPFLYLSSYIIKHKNEYYRLLRKVTIEGSWDEWILYMLKAIEETSTRTLELSQNIIHILEKTSNKIKVKKNKIYSRELVNVLFSNLYCKISDMTDNNIASRNIASTYLKELEDIGVLKAEKIGRKVVFVNKELYNLFKRTKLS